MAARSERLRRRAPKGGQRSLRDIATELEHRGYVNERGRALSGVDAEGLACDRDVRSGIFFALFGVRQKRR